MSQSLSELSKVGVSIWLDDLSRDRLTSGSLKKLIDESNVVGVTTNPSIFAASIANSDSYLPQIKELAERGASINEIVTNLTTDDVRMAADLFRPVYDKTNGVDGRVSIEVDPDLAYDVEATVSRGLALSKIVDRENLMVKVPATKQGLVAIEELTARGISINVTLIFSVSRYLEVADAYMNGLERRIANSESISKIHSVASLFVSRVDIAVDAQLPEGSELKSQVAIANAIETYEAFTKVISSSRWRNLESKGANYQRVLWASTGVKDKSLDSTRYVVGLATAHVVNTMPEGTLDATRQNGKVLGDSVTPAFASAAAIMAKLPSLGIDIQQIAQSLEDDGVKKFEDAWRQLLATIETAATSEKKNSEKN
jgi:transaldolase